MLQSETVKKYDTYKDSGIEWIGEIPQDWKVSKIKNEYKLQTGGTPDTKIPEYYEGNNKWVTIADMNSPIIYETNARITDDAIKSCSMNISPKGSLMFSFKLSIGKVAFCGDDIYTNEAIATFLPNANPLAYLYYMAPIFIIKNANENIYGAKLLNQQLIKDAKIILPPIEEQRRIADYLDNKCSKIDEVIETEKSVIEKLKEYKQSIITEAVTKGLDKTVPLKDSGIEWIGKIPKHWEDIKLKFCTYIRARLGWKGLKAEEYVEEGYPLLSAFNIVNSKLIFEDLNFINQFRYDESPEIKLQEQDILLVKDGAGIGKCAIVENMPIPSTVNGSIAVITTNDLLMGKFLYYYFLSDLFQAYIDRLKDGMGVPHLFQSDLKEITIVIPNIAEQEQIVAYLGKKCSEIDKAISDKEQVIEKFTEYKKSLIYECVTGKRKVVE